MAIFYTVDRRGRLAEGQQASLLAHPNVTPAELGAHAKDLFPDGVSPHGNQYLLGQPARDDIAGARAARIEGYVEAVRAAHYPHLPSRFVCLFGSKSLEDALTFRSSFGHSTHPIYQVKAEPLVRGRYAPPPPRRLHFGPVVLRALLLDARTPRALRFRTTTLGSAYGNAGCRAAAGGVTITMSVTAPR